MTLAPDAAASAQERGYETNIPDKQRQRSRAQRARKYWQGKRAPAIYDGPTSRAWCEVDGDGGSTGGNGDGESALPRNNCPPRCSEGPLQIFTSAELSTNDKIAATTIATYNVGGKRVRAACWFCRGRWRARKRNTEGNAGVDVGL